MKSKEMEQRALLLRVEAELLREELLRRAQQRGTATAWLAWEHASDATRFLSGVQQALREDTLRSVP